jgi:hypothetical protein
MTPLYIEELKSLGRFMYVPSLITRHSDTPLPLTAFACGCSHQPNYWSYRRHCVHFPASTYHHLLSLEAASLHFQPSLLAMVEPLLAVLRRSASPASVAPQALLQMLQSAALSRTTAATHPNHNNPSPYHYPNLSHVAVHLREGDFHRSDHHTCFLPNISALAWAVAHAVRPNEPVYIATPPLYVAFRLFFALLSFVFFSFSFPLCFFFLSFFLFFQLMYV